MVEVDPLDEKDVETVQRLVRILSGWREYGRQFVKVMSVEYRRVLAQQHLDSEAAKLASI